MSKYESYVGKKPVGVDAMFPFTLSVFDINDEEAVTAFYDGEGRYSGFRKSKVHCGEDGKMYIARNGIKYYLSNIARVGTMGFSDAPICESIM